MVKNGAESSAREKFFSVSCFGKRKSRFQYVDIAKLAQSCVERNNVGERRCPYGYGDSLTSIYTRRDSIAVCHPSLRDSLENHSGEYFMAAYHKHNVVIFDDSVPTDCYYLIKIRGDLRNRKVLHLKKDFVVQQYPVVDDSDSIIAVDRSMHCGLPMYRTRSEITSMENINTKDRLEQDSVYRAKKIKKANTKKLEQSFEKPESEFEGASEQYTVTVTRPRKDESLEEFSDRALTCVHENIPLSSFNSDSSTNEVYITFINDKSKGRFVPLTGFICDALVSCQAPYTELNETILEYVQKCYDDPTPFTIIIEPKTEVKEVDAGDPSFIMWDRPYCSPFVI